MSTAALLATINAIITAAPAALASFERLAAIWQRHPGDSIEVQRARGLELDAMFAEVDARLAAQRHPTEPAPPLEASLDSDGKDVDDLADEVRRG